MTNGAARSTDEAVLDSIRKLIEDGHPAERRPDRAAPATEKLLLTPALRIGEAPEPAHRPEPVSWSLEDRIAELEAAVGAAPQEWEPDGSEAAEQETPSRFLFQHRSAPVAAAEPQPARRAEAVAVARAPVPDLFDEADLDEEALEDDDLPDEDDLPAEGFDIGADDRLPDEDALRDLVAEIVRQELQSDLGQRVTRNIRKLVRREIRRALAAREFD